MQLAPGVISSYVNVNGIRTHYVEAGVGEPLVLVHGAGPGANGWSGWRQTVPELAKYYHVMALDTLGFGYSESPETLDYTDQASVDHLKGFIDALCLDKVYLCGNSRGAYMAAKLAVDYPERVKKLLMVSSGSIALAMGVRRTESQEGGRNKLNSYDGTPASMRTFMEAIVHDHSKITDDLIAERVAMAARPGHMFAQKSQKKFRDRLESDPNEMQRFELTHRLPKLTIPMHMVWGGRDTFAPAEFADKLRVMLPNIVFEMLPNSGHQAQNDESDKFNEIALNFLSGARVPAAV